MFRRTTTTPSEQYPTFPQTLAGLNMTLSANQPVDATTRLPFTYFINRDPRINEIHKEAFHTAMRGELKLKLAEMGVVEYFITEKNSAVLASKPKGKNIPVLMHSVSTLNTARDVVILVGESSQDCGVLAWRLVRGKEGLKRGTAMGLVSAIKEMKKDGEGVSPAVIILNPGQLFYSYREGCAKTLVSWNDGARGSGEGPDVIDEGENQLEGHKTASEHVNTFLEKILPGLINKDTRLYFIAIGDGSQTLLSSLNNKDNKQQSTAISAQTTAIALNSPSITTPLNDFSAQLKHKLAHTAKSWIPSPHPLGTPLATPAALKTNFFSTHRGRKDHPTLEGLVTSHHSSTAITTTSTTSSAEKETNIEEWEGEPPLTPTFSAGKPSHSDGITETIFQFCMSDVLSFFSMRKEQEVSKEEVVRKLERMRFEQRCDDQLAEDFVDEGEDDGDKSAPQSEGEGGDEAAAASEVGGEGKGDWVVCDRGE